MSNSPWSLNTRRFWMVVFALISLGIIGGGLAYYRYQQNQIRQDLYEDLATIADFKIKLIEGWRRERLGDANSMTRSPFLRQAVATWLQDPGTSGVQSSLLELFKHLQESYGYENILLVAPTGKILLSLRPHPASLAPGAKRSLDEAISGRQAILGDLFLCLEDDRISLDAAAPILDPQGRILAVVLLVINPRDTLYPLIQTWPTPSLTAETLLVKLDGKDVLFLNDLRHRENTALSLRVPLTQTYLSTVQVVQGKRGMFEGKDYRGVEVLGDLRPVPHCPWFMVTKVDRTEILAEARYRLVVTFLCVMLFILLTGAATAYAYRHRQASIFQDLYHNEKKLRQAQEEFRTTLYSIGDAVITTDMAGLVKQMNPVAEGLTGWLEDEAQGKTIEEVFPIVNEETRNRLENPVHRILREGEPVARGNCTLLLARDGLEHLIDDGGAPIRNEIGEVLGVVLVFSDQTEARAAQKALRQSEEDFRSLYNRTPVMLHSIDPEGKIISVSNYWLETMGYARDEVLGRHISDFMTAQSRREALEVNLPRFFQTGWVRDLEYQFVKKSGEIMDILLSAIMEKDADDAMVRSMGVVVDISVRKKAEAALRESEERFRFMAETIQDAFWIGPPDLSKIEYVSPGYEQIWGRTCQELYQSPQSFMDAFHPEDQQRVRSEIAATQAQKIPWSHEYRIIKPDGAIRWIHDRGFPVRDAQGRVIMFTGVATDVTARKRLESQFLQAQKMEAVSTLAGGIAHDFNNILTAILGNIGLALLDGKIGPQVQDRLTQAETACLRAHALSQQLLTFAKGGAPVKKIFSVAELLTESTAFTCVGSPVKCETTFPENLWTIEADPGQIDQVFQNLTINAIQVMPTGGTIKVWAENLTLGTESGLPLSAGRYIKISLRDQGMGIPAEHLPRIFDPYFTTKQKGSGLGLASTYTIIKKHHGHIAVESKRGVGTTFYIYLPAAERQVTPQPEEDRGLLVGKGNILVMDDEEMVREVLGRMLVSVGYEPEFARDGGEAIEMFVQAQGSGQAFAGVILDLTVPGGMGGKETLARLLEIDPQVKAIVSSGYSEDPIMADFQKYGFSGVIAKPYKISELGKILNQVIMKKA
jgi:two-component system, cell cycle sensor histidine kinase and response regulator CckA